jgi:hypothetical protein
MAKEAHLLGHNRYYFFKEAAVNMIYSSFFFWGMMMVNSACKKNPAIEFSTLLVQENQAKNHK